MNQSQENYDSRQQQVCLLTLAGLLILRIPFLAGVGFFNIQWKWTGAVFEIGTYLLTAFLIWWELGNLADYHIDTLAVVIIILFKPIQTLTLKYWGFNEHLLAFPNVSSLIIWIIAIVFALALRFRRAHLPSVKPIGVSWLFAGMIAGLLTTIVVSFPMSFQILRDALLYGFSKEILAEAPSAFIYQIGYAAITEEPLFRGFLWGILRKLKWREVWIWLFQADLFTFSHIYYL